MAENRSKGELTFKERIEKFEQYFHDPDHFHKIFSELGYDGCTGACECCERKDMCDTHLGVEMNHEKKGGNRA